MPTLPARAIVNPAAGGNSSYKEWPAVRDYLKRSGLNFDYVYTEAAGHARQLARDAVKAGYSYLIAVGGDGTVSDVVNGMMCAPCPGDTTLGIVSAGTACSFARSLNLPGDTFGSCKLLTGQNRMKIDIGLVEYVSQGQPQQRYFINEVDLGFGAEVVQAAQGIPNYFGRRTNYLPYVMGALGSLFTYKNKRVTLRVDGGAGSDYHCAMIVIANGAYFGGGMCLAPDARSDDGLLDMIIFGDMTKPELIRMVSLAYRGRHVNLEKVSLQRVSKVAIESADAVLAEADGELLGQGPLSFSVLPSALTVVVS